MTREAGQVLSMTECAIIALQCSPGQGTPRVAACSVDTGAWHVVQHSVRGAVQRRTGVVHYNARTAVQHIRRQSTGASASPMASSTQNAGNLDEFGQRHAPHTAHPLTLTPAKARRQTPRSPLSVTPQLP